MPQQKKKKKTAFIVIHWASVFFLFTVFFYEEVFLAMYNYNLYFSSLYQFESFIEYQETANLSIPVKIVYIVIHRQICFALSKLFIVTKQTKLPKLGSKPG